MGKRRSKTLQQEYSKTIYLVIVKSKIFELSENGINIGFNQFLKKYRYDTFALVTSDNPFSIQLPEKENKRRRVRLKCLIDLLNLKSVKASSRPNTKEWKPEIGYCLFNVDLKLAKKIGFIFDQNAIVFGRVNDKPKVVWC